MAEPLRQVAVQGSQELVCEGWAYWGRMRGHRRTRYFVGYFEEDGQAVQAWLDMLGVPR